MGAGKGYKGESCNQVMREAIKGYVIVSCSELYKRIKSRGAWTDDTIWQHFMANTVNLVPAKYRWPDFKPFLFLRPDGQYELYDSRKHPRVIK